ncbi:MAG: twin-arginine translocase TatA/TatE family subunit [Thermaerobacter sp.]|nr:twin-arginine translocase TatA/TatE family subunit [Thermaerobacter sp.]
MLDDLLTPVHLVFILVLALLIFGPRRLPEIGSSLGKGIREFRQAMTQIGRSVDTREASPEVITPTEPPEQGR